MCRPGWAMQVACFVFIQRRWVEDKTHMENMLDYFCDIREPLQLLLFPEGTDLTGKKMHDLCIQCNVAIHFWGKLPTFQLLFSERVTHQQLVPVLHLCTETAMQTHFPTDKAMSSRLAHTVISERSNLSTVTPLYKALSDHHYANQSPE